MNDPTITPTDDTQAHMMVPLAAEEPTTDTDDTEGHKMVPLAVDDDDTEGHLMIKLGVDPTTEGVQPKWE